MPTHNVPVHCSFTPYYHPWIVTAAPAGTTTVTAPPGGHLAGTFSSTDMQRAVWVSPANAVLAGVTGVSQAFTAAETNLLTSRGINLLEDHPSHGFVLTTAETTSQDSVWKYVNVRRFMIVLEQSIRQGLQWSVFEPNGPALWEIVRRIVVRFMVWVWRLGAFGTATQEDSFFVRCDRETMTESDISSRRLVCLVGVAPANPAEFIVIRIAVQTQGSTLLAEAGARGVSTGSSENRDTDAAGCCLGLRSMVSAVFAGVSQVSSGEGDDSFVP